MTTKTLWIFVFCALILASGLLMAHNQSTPVAAASTFEIPKAEIKEVQERALAGDCLAAERIGRHHLFFTLDTSEMIKWYRVAAKCPDAQVKAVLVNILLNNSAMSVEVVDEIDKLLVEIRELDPSFAAKFQSTVDRLRLSSDE